MQLLASITRLSRRELLILNERLQEKLRSLDASDMGLVKASVSRSIQRHSGKAKVSLSRVSKRELSLAVEAIDIALLRLDLHLSRKHYVAFIDILCEEAVRRIRNKGEFEDAVGVVRQLCHAGNMVQSAFPGYGKAALELVLRQKCARE